MSLTTVTATTNPPRAYPCLKTWGGYPFIGIVNGEAGRIWHPTEKEEVGILSRTWVLVPEYLGTVPAFRIGVDYALDETQADIIACLHDDVEILETGWVERVQLFFETHPACGLLGFGGAKGLGLDGIYTVPYEPKQLARIAFRSNLTDAESHGTRSLFPERVVCLDGFSQIGRREYWAGEPYKRRCPSCRSVGFGFSALGPDHCTFCDGTENSERPASERQQFRPLTHLESLGMKHHFYDGALGCLAARQGWEVWYLPIRCRHLGGRTAVGDPGYQYWAREQTVEGDHGFWVQSHQIGYEEFRDVLPLRLPH